MSLATMFKRNSLLDERSTWITSVVLIVGMLAVVVLHALPPDHAWHLNGSVVSLLGKYLTYMLLALAVDLIWGYLGILSLGHGAFFALGGYAMGLYLTAQQAPLAPWQAVMAHFPVAALAVILAPGLLALVFGWLAFRSRVTGVYFSIITQALTFALMLAFNRNEMAMGGSTGLTRFDELLGFALAGEGMTVALFVASGVAVLLAFWGCKAVTRSRLGRVCMATRDAEARVRFIGYRVEHVKLAVFVLSAMIAGVAGALYVPQVGIINPSTFAPLFSIEVVVWVALGGRATLYGALLGALVVNYLKTVLTGVMPDAWLFLLGGLFVVVTMFLPQGVAGLMAHLRRRREVTA
ncbi:urea ABC transporter permease subunit UrtC [Chromohalobacter israelensis]|jgi:urea transport system permease protein|uniref:Amino acid/amide ABC transporter membrane protein 2, HAAT family n=1 Tax=Chromohalobacter israelensis (strain ATCC BAA-138 / DSM 3043 / CIP 106854 / NCIMB 13768 / 1H11) TaxID=290398 RepID=Q1QV47_CHRI1|nr:urea ABC transporter permease subunit UrtC [Chromohalobacter salexigens]ABE59661.1 amino acid/amide ABC transporter membrane protein 2, HAAT family [Chromohalobacter salexigens DSM 3043]NWO57103.1 urea ABC transporter permease subunit UrtC [Chromohalobacter salexigens]